jgi:diguanylate cyclase
MVSHIHKLFQIWERSIQWMMPRHLSESREQDRVLLKKSRVLAQSTIWITPMLLITSGICLLLWLPAYTCIAMSTLVLYVIGILLNRRNHVDLAIQLIVFGYPVICLFFAKEVQTQDRIFAWTLLIIVFLLPVLCLSWKQLLRYVLIIDIGLLVLFSFPTFFSQIYAPEFVSWIGRLEFFILFTFTGTFAMIMSHSYGLALREADRSHELLFLNEQLEFQATHDLLTGLPNQRFLQTTLEQTIDKAMEENSPATVLIIGLARFKEINKEISYQVGDMVLKEIKTRLTHCLRPNDFIARLGENEFAIVLPATNADQSLSLAGRMLETFDAPFITESHTFMLECNIGMAVIPEYGNDSITALRNATIAFDAAKKNHQKIVSYTQDIDHYNPRKLTLIGELRQAITDGKLLLYYQPKISLADNHIVGVEALVRWPHPVHGIIPPDEFIPLAERTGLIIPLTHWVIEQALRQYHEWNQQGIDLSVAVNLSTSTLYAQETFLTITNLLYSYQIPPDRLTLEITESMVMDEPEKAVAALAAIREAGVSISIDDFGTGYSSLAYLKRFPIDEVKIDKAFILKLYDEKNLADKAIVRAVVAMASPLQCKIVAEGVENEETRRLLQEFGCHFAQGYYFAKPLPPEALEEWIRTSQWGVRDRQGVAA